MRPAGDRPVDGVYEPIEVERVAEDILQGHSDVPDLDIRWNDGRPEWYDSETGRHIATLSDERAVRLHAEAEAEVAGARADGERAARVQAKGRDRELEEELRRLRGG